MTSKKLVTQTVTTTVTMKASQFHDLVAPVMPLADKSGNLPALGAVLIQANGPYLLATATDRYRVGIQRVRLDEAAPGFTALISLRSLKSILSIFKVSRSADPDLSITSAEHMLTVDAIGAMDLDPYGIVSGRMSWPLVAGDYPKGIHDIITASSTAQPEGPLLLNANLLADFKFAQVQGHPMVMRGRVEGATFIQIGPDFIGAIMSVRASLASELDADWTTFLAPSKTEVAA